MRKVISLLTLIVFLSACQSNKKESQVQNPNSIHKAIAQEVLQVSEYTYLRVLEEDGKEIWLAAPSIQAEIGQTYYFKKGMEMSNFNSKELNKTFETVYFIDKLSTDPNMSTPAALNNTSNSVAVTNQAAKPMIEKKEVNIEPLKNAITIAELYKDLNAFKGKKVTLKGQVTKYNPAILNKNWIHIQDGTEYNDKFDLTATITSEVKVGDIVTIEGVITINKDFGYGYVYELIMEDAVLKQ
jgi:PBP1b-binding outer membrane lipoprotein LpoB